ncbi:CTD kinase subunit gamma [Echria macrotheca]|uniref:CTD kinase subunit gamma n=1 Tax=Echria macrotheca TaxID=438768 RepID=A0AAJ0BDA5_9PEZI|nr:CTD kinase subunit gamma [Echria macrotheca]
MRQQPEVKAELPAGEQQPSSFDSPAHALWSPLLDHVLSSDEPVGPSSSDDDDRMADPFEVRMRFTNQLRGLNASVTSAQKAAQFAIKYHAMAEDLHSCIVEQLAHTNMNTRANIMYFLEHFLDMCRREGHNDYVYMIQRDIFGIVDAVAPDDGTGAANVKVVRTVLQALQSKSFLEAHVVDKIQDALKERDPAAQELVLTSSPASGDYGGDDPNMAPSQTLQQTTAPSSSATSRRPGGANATAAAGGLPRLDRKQVEQRIEEDRERHKRLRENIWAVPEGDYVELDRLWEETSSLNDDDIRMMEEEHVEWAQDMMNACVHRREVADAEAAREAREKEKNGGDAH